MLKHLAAATLIAVAPVCLHAQRPDTTALPDSVRIQLAAIEVIGSIVATTTGPSIHSGLAGRALEIGHEELRTWRPKTGANALRRAAAATYDDLGSPFKQSMVLRGFSVGPVVGMPQGVSVFVDGVPVNELGSGEVSFDLLPLQHVERIEVLTGTASLLGPNALGGAVNLVTRRGGGAARASVEVEAGSHRLFRGVGNVAGSAGAFEYYAGGGFEQEDGWRRSMGGERSHVFGSAGSYGTRSGFRVQALAAESNAETAGSLPLSVYTARPDSNLTAGDFEALRQIQLAASGYTHTLGGLASVRMFFRGNSGERFNANQEDDPDIRGFSKNRTWGAHADWRVNRAVGRNRVSFRAGGGATANRTSVQLFAERVDPGETTNVESPIRRYDAYAVGEWNTGPATVSAGIRFDAVRVPFRNVRNPARDTTSNFVQMSPRASLSLRLSEALTTYASIGRGFRAPALIEIACADPEEPCPLPFALGDDPPIDPVRVLTYDAGLKWMSRNFVADASVYRSNVQDDIFLFPYHDESEPAGSTIDGYFGNVERTRREGVELSARLHGRVVDAWASYGLSRATFQSGDVEIFSIREAAGAQNEVEAGDRFPLVPSSILNIGVDMRFRALEAGAVLSYTGSRYLRGDEANDEAQLEGYATVDVRAAYAWRDWEVDALVRNIANTEHIQFGTFNINQGAGNVLERFVTPGAPRTLEIALRRNFR